MNDWLLPVQQWESAKAFPDAMGRFHDPAPSGRRTPRPRGSTSRGSWTRSRSRARRATPSARRPTGARSCGAGLRSLAQLTFLDEVDMFYVSERDLLRGGVRTTVYDNEVRVDDVQHGLMGMLRILDTFGAGDFRP